MTPENKALMERYPQYYRDVSHLEVIDVYRVIDLFNVTDATAQHALKKLLLSGQRTGGKPIEVDLKEARDTLSRGLAMRAEDANKHQLGFDFAAPGTQSFSPPPLPAPPLVVESTLVPPVPVIPLTPPPPAPQQAIRFCSHEGCEMRVRTPESAHCIIHSNPDTMRAWQPVTDPVPPAPVVAGMCKEEGCDQRCAPNAIRCVAHCAPPAPAPTLHSGPGSAPRVTR